MGGADDLMSAAGVFLDTNALLFFLVRPARLTPAARQAIAVAPDLSVSAASLWEVATKYRIGKLPEASPLFAAGTLVHALAGAGVHVVPVNGYDAETAGSVPAAHGDPFDRMIAAHAARLGVPLVSNDAALDAFGVTRIW